MKCKQVKKLIMEFLCGELPSELVPELQRHLAECVDCSRYKEEIQQTIECVKQSEEIQASVDLAALHDTVINRKRLRAWRILRPRRTVWGAAVIGACFILLSVFTMLAAEIQYGDNTLIIRFGRTSRGQEVGSTSKPDLSSEMNSLYQRTASILDEYRKGQLQFEGRLSREMQDSGIALSRIIKMLNDYESQRDRQIAIALQQMQIRQSRMFETMQRDLETLALQTQKEFERNYQAMAAVSELVASSGF